MQMSREELRLLRHHIRRRQREVLYLQVELEEMEIDMDVMEVRAWVVVCCCSYFVAWCGGSWCGCGCSRSLVDGVDVTDESCLHECCCYCCSVSAFRCNIALVEAALQISC
jgi:hypothetical protein